MSIPNTKKRNVSPTHPGEMLREDFMPDFGLNVSSLATALGVSRQTANELVHCRRAVTPVMALRLSHLFGNSSMFWLNAQNAYDLWHAERRHCKELEAVVLLKAA
jgi:antitoxin HigA-1